MRIKVLSRSETAHTRARRDDPFVQPRNLDPTVHPFEKEREYVRAVRGAKLSRMFAKPLLGALEGHADGVMSMAVSPRSLVAMVSGAADGEVRVWDLASRTCVWRVDNAHDGFVRGLAVCADGQTFISCGIDKTVKLWGLNSGDHVQTFVHSEPFMGCDAHWRESNTFATCGEEVCVWDTSRLEPVHKFSWGADAVIAVKYNPAEPGLLGSVSGSDRSIVLYDTRQAVPMRKVIQAMRNNQLAWNPMEPMYFTTANEDGNLYTFDMRRLDKAYNVHRDHVSAVMDVHYSPTGREIVAGSYDKSVRIFPTRGESGKSREIYTAPRMQRVFCVRFSQDARFVMSGSDDDNIRLWKAFASKPLGTVGTRQRRQLDYNEALIARYRHFDEVRRIHKGRHVPRFLLKQSRARHDAEQKERRKRERVAKNNRSEQGEHLARKESRAHALRKRSIVAQMD